MPWVEKVRAAQEKAQMLEQMAAQAKRAGVEAAPNLAAEAKAARQVAHDAKPVAVRLQRAEERLGVAEEKLALAQKAFDQAAVRVQQATAHAEKVQAELGELQQEMAKAKPEPATAELGGRGDCQLAVTVRRLLAKLEQGRTPDGCDETQEVVGKLHALLEKAAPTPAGRLDEPLVDECVWGRKRAADLPDGSSENDEDLPGPCANPPQGWMQDFFDDAAFDKSDAELAAMTRSALTQHRGRPY